MKRRDFLLTSLASFVFVACGSSDGAPAETKPASPDGGGDPSDPDGGLPKPPEKPVTPTSTPDKSDFVFPQGLASGDPRPDRVILWTRIEAVAAGKKDTESIEVEYVIAKDEGLKEIVARGTATAAADEDHTLRLVPTGLEPGRFYYYRFEHAGTTTRVARTKTAPAPDADVPVKFAFCACQDYIGRYWHSWKALLDEKADLDFILYLGDYIYETVNDARFQTTSPDRAIKLPDGTDTSDKQDGSRISALTLADYRTVYKTYRKEALLKEVHRLYPFVLTWDDHEFADDCWADHSTSFNELDPKTKGYTSEQNTARRQVANRAFFEYQPMEITYDKTATFPNDIKIYRTLTYGKHVEIFMTDQRMYRADHLIPEGPRDTAVGKLTENSMVGSRYFMRKSVFDEREEKKKPSLLGEKQKLWFLDAIKKSKATWKLWGNEVQMYQMALQLGKLPNIPELVTYTVYVNGDQWDGFRSERREILTELTRANVENLLVCTGDIHSFFAAEIHVDFDAPGPKPIGVEYVTAGISSASLNSLIDNAVPKDSALRPVADNWALHAPDALMETNKPFLKFADTNAYGFTLVNITAAQTEVTFVQLGDPREKNYGGVTSRQKFVTKVGTNKVEVL
jgi:alkaline phosphatase D